MTQPLSRCLLFDGPEQANVLVEAVALRVVELLDERGSEPAGMVDTATVARMLGVSRDCVYAHAEELGGVRVGSGKRAPLRFDPVRARDGARRLAGEGSREPVSPSPAGDPSRRRSRSSGRRRTGLPVTGSILRSRPEDGRRRAD